MPAQLKGLLPALGGEGAGPVLPKLSSEQARLAPHLCQVTAMPAQLKGLLPALGSEGAGPVLPQLSSEQAGSMQRELFARYSDPEFQLKLYQVILSTDPHSPARSEARGALARAVRDEVLPRFGLPAGEGGDAALALALSEFEGDQEVEAATASIDSLLLDEEGPEAKSSARLGRKDVLLFCRRQLAAFRRAEFQQELWSAERAVGPLGADGGAGRRDALVRKEHEPILSELGLEPGERGMLAVIDALARHMADADVAAHVDAANTLIGMDKLARERFAARLRRIGEEAPELPAAAFAAKAPRLGFPGRLLRFRATDPPPAARAEPPSRRRTVAEVPGGAAAARGRPRCETQTGWACGPAHRGRRK